MVHGSELEDYGALTPERLPKLICKYPKKTRNALGAALRTTPGGMTVIVKADPFEFTSFTLIGVFAYEKAQKTELNRVQKLNGVWKQFNAAENRYLQRYGDT